MRQGHNPRWKGIMKGQGDPKGIIIRKKRLLITSQESL